LLRSERTHTRATGDMETGKTVRTISTSQPTMHMVAAGNDLHFAAATSIQDGTVALFDLRSVPPLPPTIIATGEGAEGIAAHPTGSEVWVGNRAANTIAIVAVESAKVEATLDTGDFPFRLVFTPDGNRVLVTCAESGEVQIFDRAERTLLHTLSITADGSEQGALPMGICTDPDGTRCYVTCGRGEFVAVIDLGEHRVLRRLKTRAGPDGIGYARIIDNGTVRR
ncbi:MAG: beta-propeller fold lactonase family protein, partial [Planctomycetes bacterium]|nr:beta-propeller fold lactonase family protein [Planctomycetota bacterium]